MSATLRPRRMTTTLLQTCQRCSRLWVTITMVSPRALRRLISSSTSRDFSDAERRRRLVEKQELAAPEGAARNRHQLALTAGHPLHRPPAHAWNVDVQVLKPAERGVSHRLSPHQPEQRRPASEGKLATKKDVFGGSEGADERQVLVDRLDAEPLGLDRPRKGDGASLQARSRQASAHGRPRGS